MKEEVTEVGWTHKGILGVCLQGVCGYEVGRRNSETNLVYVIESKNSKMSESSW